MKQSLFVSLLLLLIAPSVAANEVLLQNVNILNPGNPIETADILIRDGVIAAIEARG